MGLDEVVQLLHHIDLLALGGKVPDKLFGKGPHQAQLQIVDRVPHGLFHILVGGARGDDADLGAVVLDPVQRGGLRVSHQRAGAGLHLLVLGPGKGGQHDVFGGVLFILLQGQLFPLPILHNGAGMGDAGGQPQDDRGVELLGELVGQLGKVPAFLGVGGLHHGDLGGPGIVAGVLLVLGGVHAGVIGHGQHHAAVYTDIAHGEQGVGGHVQAHMLHGAEGPGPADRGAAGGFGGHLFIGGPLAVDFGVFHGGLGDLGAGGAGIGGHHPHTGLIQAAGNGFVAQVEMFHERSSSPVDTIKNGIHPRSA